MHHVNYTYTTTDKQTSSSKLPTAPPKTLRIPIGVPATLAALRLPAFTFATMGAHLTKLSTHLTATPPPIGALPPPCPPVPPSVHHAESELLSHLTKIPYEKRQINLPTGYTLNTLSFGAHTSPPLVLLHGWGSASAFFGRNVASLSQSRRLHLVDLLGFGASSRPFHSISQSPAAAEAFFTRALRDWADEMSKQEANFDKFHLVGHSMGAFIASCFALQFPHKVLSLVLASPVGLPRAPAQKIPRGLPFLRATLYAFVFMLWECGYTPQGAVRALGANFGRRLSAWIIAPRLPTSDGNTRAAIAEYFYQISSARGSGEFALSTVLESGAYARRPLCDRLGDVKVGTVFLYGDRDWMSSEVAHGICENMKVRTRVKIVENAGHHLYYDNVQMFGDMVKEACDEADEEHRRKENNADVAHMLTDQLTARQREQTL